MQKIAATILLAIIAAALSNWAYVVMSALADLFGW